MDWWGVLFVEKWMEDKVPFEVMWEYIDAGHFEIDNLVPQGPMTYRPDQDGQMHLEEEGM